jgi:hypothetical protein
MWRKRTFPRSVRHSTFSNRFTFDLSTTPVRNLCGGGIYREGELMRNGNDDKTKRKKETDKAQGQ